MIQKRYGNIVQAALRYEWPLYIIKPHTEQRVTLHNYALHATARISAELIVKHGNTIDASAHTRATVGNTQKDN